MQEMKKGYGTVGEENDEEVTVISGMQLEPPMAIAMAPETEGNFIEQGAHQGPVVPKYVGAPYPAL